MSHEILEVTTVHPTQGYSHVAKAGKTLYIAGQVAKDSDGNLIGKGDFEAQARQVFSNLKSILEEAHGKLRNIVKTTVFLTHSDHVGAYRSIRDECIQEPFPPSTLLVVQSLALPEFLIEVEAIAVLD